MRAIVEAYLNKPDPKILKQLTSEESRYVARVGGTKKKKGEAKSKPEPKPEPETDGEGAKK